MAEYEDYEDRRETSIGTTRSKNGFVDPAGVYPKREYVDKASTNAAARGIRENKLYIGGGDKYLNLDIKKRPVSAVADNFEVRDAKLILIKVNTKNETFIFSLYQCCVLS